MDCVTCLLVGMCMLCGQNLGGSRLQSLATSEAANPGRPMTRAEVDTALQSAINHLNSNVISSSNSYLRQSKLDPRFSHMGIGKRLGTKVDPYHFVAGLGKRTPVGQEVLGDALPVVDDPESMGETSRRGSRLSPTGDNDAVNLKSTTQEAAYSSYTATNPFIFSHLLERPSQFTESEDWESQSRTPRELRLRRMQLRLQPTISLLVGARRRL